MEYEIILNPSIKDIEKILELDKKFYKDEYLWNPEYQKKLFEKNQESFILVKEQEKLIGYLNYLCITEEKYESIKKSNITVDEFSIDDICEFKKGKNYITINSIVIDSEYQNKEVIKIINDGFLEKLNRLEKEEIKIAGIDGVAVSEDGRKYFKSIGFRNCKELEDGNEMFSMDENIIETINDAIEGLKQKIKQN